MARIRSIKPEFWTAEQVMECSPLARLAFIGLWNFCDDAGIHPASPKTLKAEVFPSDDITSTHVAEMVRELVTQGLLEEYEVDGRQFWAVTGWHHQKIDQPTYKHPRPDGTVPEGAPRRRIARAKPPAPPGTKELFGEHSPNDRGAFTPGEERRGVEGKGGEGKGVNPLRPPVERTEREVAREMGEVPPQTPDVPARAIVPDTPTRRGLVCRLLREAGIADAAPHHLTSENWDLILAKRSDEDIVEFARMKLEARPGQRLGIKYLAPGLMEDPEPVMPHSGARSPPGRPSRSDEARAWGIELTTASSSEREIVDDRTIDA